jgi:hypothetical protein
MLADHSNFVTHTSGRTKKAPITLALPPTAPEVSVVNKKAISVRTTAPEAAIANFTQIGAVIGLRLIVNLSPKCGHQRNLLLGCSPNAIDHS